MKFTYKTSAQLEKMDDAERDQYATDKREFEQAEADKKIEDGIAAGLETVKTELAKDFTPKAEVESQIDAVKTELTNTITLQGAEISALKSTQGAMKTETLSEVFKTAYDMQPKDGEYSVKGQEKIAIDITKVTVSTDVLSSVTVGSGTFPASGSTGVMDAATRTLMSQQLGFASYRKPWSPIMEVVDVMPLDSGRLAIINESYTGDAAITPECALKPIVKVTYSEQETAADPVAAEWATTTKLRRFYPTIANKIEKKVTELVVDKVPAAVLALVQAGATAFTPNAALNISGFPNDYDAIGAIIAQLENLGFMPNAVVLNPIAYRNMKQDKTTEGVYTLWNGQSISLIGNYGFEWGGRVIRWVMDPTIAVDSFLIGDFLQTVKVGLDSEVLYFETDGRTDAVSTVASGLSRNIRTHVVERFVAVIIPTATNIGLVGDTFTNVKTLITAS